jgi:sugar/nucleoside kinase (ribokinase family)
MLSEKLYDVVCIGNYTKDTIITPSGTRFVDGGGMNYAAHAAKKLGCHVGVVTRLAREDDRVVEKFRSSGIDCYPMFTPSSTLMCLAYPTDNPDIRTLTVAATAGAITSNEVNHLRMKAAVISSSLRGEVGLDVMQSLKKMHVNVAADMQGFVRVLLKEELTYQPWPEMREALALVDILKSDAVEAEFLTGERDIHLAAKVFQSMGPREIVLTHKDGLLIKDGEQTYEFGFFPSNLSGRSGRGDTCIGSYAAMRLTKDARDAGTWAAAVTSLKMEKLGPFDRSIEDVKKLIKQRYDHGKGG